MTHLPLRGALAPLTLPGKAPSTLPNGLVSYWKLEEASGNRADSVGVNTLTSNLSVGQVAGKIGNAALFTAASNNYLSIANASQTGLNFTSSFTFSLWFNVTSLPNTSNGLINKSTSVAAGGGYTVVLIDQANDVLRFICADGTNNRLAQITLSGSITTGVWHHLITWYDAGANSLNLQFNGGSVTSSTPAGSAPIASTAEFQIGRFVNTVNDFNGGIDEVACWSRVLTSDERAALYNAGSGNQYPFS